MKCKKLFTHIPIQSWRGSKEVEISGLCNDSRKVAPGNLFIAKKGHSVDGTIFAKDAISNGAVAILSDLYDPFLSKEIVQIIHEDVAAIEALLAARYYSFPAEELFVVGITGTSGKTTTSYLIHHLLEKIPLPSGLMGTVEIISGRNRYDASNTTMDPLTNQKLLREMLLGGCKACVMEVSSHGLVQGRVEEIPFDAVLFTNLTHEHLDYHKTKEEYMAAKKKLFTSLQQKKNGKKTYALFNADDPNAKKMMEGCPGEIITFGIEREADLQASNITLSLEQTQVVLSYKEQKEFFISPLVGRYNIYNLCGAVALGLSMGITLRWMSQIFSSFPQVPGRLERILQPHPFSIYVDYAHKVDALEKVLSSLREVATGRILTLFGCGGNRDREKRPLMAKVAETFSDLVVVTSDNPRSEDPQKIIDEILVGFSTNRYLVEIDRRKAIEKILQLARKGDLVLLVGKGHETYQIFATKRLSFDDRKVAKEICDALYF